MLNTEQIFERAGGNASLRKMLTVDAGSAPTMYTVGMWRSRQRIAQKWAAQCVASLMTRDPSLKFQDLIIDDNPF